jgi:hypothetical protein
MTSIGEPRGRTDGGTGGVGECTRQAPKVYATVLADAASDVELQQLLHPGIFRCIADTHGLIDNS